MTAIQAPNGADTWPAARVSCSVGGRDDEARRRVEFVAPGLVLGIRGILLVRALTVGAAPRL